MGHERVGYLPKTKKWKSIVTTIGEFSEDPSVVADIAVGTTKNVRTRFKEISDDDGVLYAFKYLILLSAATNQDNAYDFLNKHGILMENGCDLFDLGITAKKFIENHQESKEYSKIASQSLMDTIATWFEENESSQTALFDTPDNPLVKWKKASTGGGFSELSRLFFSNFTKRYLRYFLEREAAWHLKKVEDRVRFNKQLENFVEDISKHAFETSKITESFSAAWFNKHATSNQFPTDRKIQGFVDFAFKKINSELLREENT